MTTPKDKAPRAPKAPPRVAPRLSPAPLPGDPSDLVDEGPKTDPVPNGEEPDPSWHPAQEAE